MAEKATPKKKSPARRKPATDPIAREKQMISLAEDLAEKQLTDGTAAASVINHYLKLASSREVIEREILEKQARLISAKADAIASGKESESIAREAIEAMRSYSSSSTAR